MGDEKLVKSRQRVADHGEVFTPRWLVDDMLDLVKGETERIDSRFLEPTFMRKSNVSRDRAHPTGTGVIRPRRAILTRARKVGRRSQRVPLIARP